MKPAFSSWHDFLAMGGYGFYVWLAVSVTLLSLAALAGHTLWQRRQLLKSVRQYQARERRIRAAKMKRAASEAAGE
ncbi:heme exporter protein CcmD [Pantoea alhagi]|uniref:Heme exporter protein D n=1 Tax=Pantoea alhagi TaxID=1891675 RepID=A0A1W6B743_9GAMM|nr:heme exporter protein CcmD [Pantoea alhagi]ARJ42901.1 heme exporter protein CcmD [Pantoea alhagi]URQ59829.1 heme exporter protein CcmD [Pantoea alhagi]